MKTRNLFITVMIVLTVVLGAACFYQLVEAQNKKSKHSEKSCNTNTKADGYESSKAVKLADKYISAGALFNTKCGECHKTPDAAQPVCFSGLTTAEHVSIWNYQKAMSTKDSRYSKNGKALYESKCVACHKLPDPTKPDCSSNLLEIGVAQIHEYMADAQAGKALYESNCGSCHSLIKPYSQIADYWSKHLCTGGCTEKNFSDNEEQQMLLYLTTHSKI